MNLMQDILNKIEKAVDAKRKLTGKMGDENIIVEIQLSSTEISVLRREFELNELQAFDIFDFWEIDNDTLTINVTE